MMKKKLVFIVLFMIFSCSEKKNQIVNEETGIKTDMLKKNPEEMTFTWNTELCINEGNYDPKKYTEAELKATYELWWDFNGYLNLDVLPRDDQDFAIASIEKLDEKYKKVLWEIENLQVVNTPYWHQLKKNKIREINEGYELKKIAINAIVYPQALMENRFTNHCKEYAEALSSMNDELLIQTWTDLVKKQMEKNGSPDRVLAKFNQQNGSVNRLIYARNQVMTYGWWNCANQIIYHFEDDGTPQKEFEKLFTNIKKECDEP